MIPNVVPARLKAWHLALGLSFFFQACAPAYIPNAVNVPMHQEKGEVAAAVNYGTSGFDPQVSYAITDNVGAMLNASFRNDPIDTNNNYHRHLFVEGGLGLFKWTNENMVLECYGGFGYGNINAHMENSLFTSTAKVNGSRIFLQPSVGFKWKNADLALVNRFALVDLRQGNERASALFTEPVLSIRVGTEQIKLVIQTGISIPLHEGLAFAYQPFLINLGLHIRPGKFTL
ncbi:MAG: hypothetical protein EP332_14265 [Bacteroidetes bacterium]|nr:MAG: hypothetical protein EP332_14265 [Bacteroidota bacterium]